MKYYQLCKTFLFIFIPWMIISLIPRLLGISKLKPGFEFVKIIDVIIIALAIICGITTLVLTIKSRKIKNAKR